MIQLPVLSAGRVIQGTRISYNVDNRPSWSANGLSVPSEMLVLATAELVQRWQGMTAVETILPDANVNLPDVAALNEQIPEDTWEIGPYGPKPPWCHQHVCYLLSVADASLYTYINHTAGTRVAVDMLRSSVEWMRALRRLPDAMPLVELTDAPFPTKFGMRRRPHFKILSWHSLSDGRIAGGKLKALPAIPLGEEIDDENPF